MTQFQGLVNVLYLPLGALKMTVHLKRTGQWKQCCDDLMKIELPSPRKPAPVTPKQGSLYHEMGENLSLVTSLRMCDHKISFGHFCLKSEVGESRKRRQGETCLHCMRLLCVAFNFLGSVCMREMLPQFNVFLPRYLELTLCFTSLNCR